MHGARAPRIQCTVARGAGWTLRGALGTMLCMSPPRTGQWRCRICNFERYHQVSVPRKDGSRYLTSFYACSLCSVMFLNPAQWSADSAAAANIEAPPTVVSALRRKR